MRPTRLSEIEHSLNPGLQKIIKQIWERIEDEITIQHAAELLKISSRRIYQLCISGDLDFVRFPQQKILKKSLIKYILARHGIDNIEVDNLRFVSIYLSIILSNNANGYQNIPSMIILSLHNNHLFMSIFSQLL